MKKSLFPLSLILLFSLCSQFASAQEKSEEKSAAPAISPAPPSPPSPPAVDNQRLELIPSDSGRLPSPAFPPIPPVLVEKAAKSLPVTKDKKTKTEVEEANMADRVRYRLVKTKAVNDPKVQELWADAQQAKTDYQKREILKSYYQRLYGRMLQLDRSLKTQIDLAQKISLSRVTQRRVTATEAFEERF